MVPYQWSNTPLVDRSVAGQGDEPRTVACDTVVFGCVANAGCHGYWRGRSAPESVCLSEVGVGRGDGPYVSGRGRCLSSAELAGLVAADGLLGDHVDAVVGVDD